MKILQIKAPGRAEVIEMPDPSPGPGAVILRVEAIASCPHWDITMLAGRRSDMLEVNTTAEGTAVLFRKGHSTEVVKLCIAVIIPLILFITAILMACTLV